VYIHSFYKIIYLAKSDHIIDDKLFGKPSSDIWPLVMWLINQKSLMRHHPYLSLTDLGHSTRSTPQKDGIMMALLSETTHADHFCRLSDNCTHIHIRTRTLTCFRRLTITASSMHSVDVWTWFPNLARTHTHTRTRASPLGCTLRQALATLFLSLNSTFCVFDSTDFYSLNLMLFSC
jgi:hypothetical protein